MLKPHFVGCSRRGSVVMTAIVALAILTASCSDSVRAVAPRSSLGSRVASPTAKDLIGASEDADVPTAAPPEQSWALDEVVPVALDSPATARQLRSAAVDMLGPTNDVVAHMNRLIAFPELPMPERADVIDFRADNRRTLDGARTVTTAEVAVTVEGTVAGVVAYYEEQLAEQGASVVARGERHHHGVTVHLMSYELPGESDRPSDLALEIRSSPPLAGEPRARLDIRHVTSQAADDATELDRLVGWIADLPLPEDGVVTGAGVQTSSVGRSSLHYTLTLTFDRKEPSAVASELRAALPSGGFDAEPRSRAGDDTDNWVFLTNAFFDEGRVSIHDGSLGGRARTLVSIDARVDLGAVTPLDS